MKVIECGTLIDGLADEPVRDAVVLVDGDTVEATGPRETISIPEGAEQIDHSNQVVVPGLVDAHLHLNGTRTFSSPSDRLTKSVQLSTARATGDLRKLLDAGFTSVRDMGSSAGLALAAAVEEGEISGPRIYTSGPNFSQTAGASDHNSLPYDWATSQHSRTEVAMSTVVDGVDECRKAARKRIREGADVLKVFGTGAGFHGLGQPEHSAYTPAEIRTFAEEAHRVGVPLAAHLIGEEGTETAVRNGVDTVEHGWYTDEETVESMVEESVTLVPTLYTIHRFAHAGTAENTPPRFEDLGGPEKARRAEESAIDATKRAHEAGVPIALGTDAMGNDLLPHGENARETELLVEHVDMTPMDALKTATSVGACAIGDDRIGAVAEGRYADLVALDADPLADVTALGAVSAVYKGGERVAG